MCGESVGERGRKKANVTLNKISKERFRTVTEKREGKRRESRESEGRREKMKKKITDDA